MHDRREVRHRPNAPALRPRQPNASARRVPPSASDMEKRRARSSHAAHKLEVELDPTRRVAAAGHELEARVAPDGLPLAGCRIPVHHVVRGPRRQDDLPAAECAPDAADEPPHAGRAFEEREPPRERVDLPFRGELLLAQVTDGARGRWTALLRGRAPPRLAMREFVMSAAHPSGPRSERALHEVAENRRPFYVARCCRSTPAFRLRSSAARWSSAYRLYDSRASVC